MALPPTSQGTACLIRDEEEEGGGGEKKGIVA